LSVKINKSLERYKTGLGFLLIVASTSTLFGLFGTVWGIMKSFSDVVAAQTASLVVLAPGISASLITTVFGLISALPALMAYYIYSGKVANLEVDLENFELELMSILSKELEQ
jgi:biopolymer transport protein TolQ